MELSVRAMRREFDVDLFLRQLKTRIPSAEYLEEASSILPSEQLFRIPLMSTVAACTSLRGFVGSAACPCTFPVTLRKRENIGGLSPRVETANRTHTAHAKKTFLPWPLDPATGLPALDGYGCHTEAGSLAHAIHAFQKTVLSIPSAMKRITLMNKKECECAEDERLTLARHQIHTLTEDGTYICLTDTWKQVGEVKVHTTCTYEFIYNKTMGTAKSRQLLVYKEGVLGIFVYVPTGEVTYGVETKTTGASMYAEVD